MKRLTSLITVLLVTLVVLATSVQPTYATTTAQYLPGGKNYMDINNFTVTSTSMYSDDSIAVKPSTTYTFSFSSEMYVSHANLSIYGNGMGDFYIEDDDQFTYVSAGDYYYYTFTTDANEYSIDLYLSTQNLGTYIAAEGFSTVQLEEGSTRTAVETYIEPSPDSTPPLINGATAVWLVNVDNPTSVADLKATLTAVDETDGDLTASITVPLDQYTGNEDTLGDYDVQFSVSDNSGNTTTITVIFRVVDVTDPLINLSGATNYYLEYGTSWSDPGYTCTDNYDPSCTVVVTGSVNDAVLGTYTLNYNATDSSGNDATQKTRNVIVQDTTAPSISLQGQPTTYVEFGSNYTEYGATWSDAYDGTGSATISGTVNVGVLGTYYLYYDVTDSNGNVATTVTRTVIVRDTTAPLINSAGTYTYNITDWITLDDILATITATDAHGGNMTASIVVTTDNFQDQGHLVGTYTVDLAVTDSSGNTGTETITIIIEDNKVPVFTTSASLLTVEYADSMTQQDLKDYFGVQ